MGSFKKFLTENEELLTQIMDIVDGLDEEELEEFGEYLYYEFFDDEESDEDDYDFFDVEDVKSMINELGQEFYEDILDMLEEIEDESDDDEEDEEDEEDELEEGSPLQDLKKMIGKKLWHKNYAVALDMMKKTGKSAADVARMILHVDARELQTAYDRLNEACGTCPNPDDCDICDDLDEGISRIMKTKNMNKKKRKFMATSKAELRKTKVKRKQAARKNKAKAKRYYKANKKKIAAYQKSRAAAIKKGKHKVKMRRKA
jgi:hypothetical protein